MDAVFWTGLLLGALIGLPISITANLWTEPVRELLHIRRRIRYSEKKSRELRRYFYVKALRDGDPTAKILLDMQLNDVTRALLFLLGSTFLYATCIALISQPYAQDYRSHIRVFAAVSGLIEHDGEVQLATQRLVSRAHGAQEHTLAFAELPDIALVEQLAV